MSMKFFIIYILIVLISFILYAVVRKIAKGNEIKARELFLEKYPNAVKVYIQKSGGFVVNSNLYVHTVNGAPAVIFNDEEGHGFYCNVGKSIVEAEHAITRPGIIYKNVTKSTGTAKIEIETKEKEEYFFYYNKESKNFVVDLK